MKLMPKINVHLISGIDQTKPKFETNPLLIKQMILLHPKFVYTKIINQLLRNIE